MAVVLVEKRNLRSAHSLFGSKGTRAKRAGAGNLVADRLERSVQLVLRPHELGIHFVPAPGTLS